MDWPRFLADHHIEFITKGHNVGAGNVGINCPFCLADGDPDPSEHLTISLTNRGWSCWRNKRHRGKDPVRLVQALLRCSHAEAQSLAGDGSIVIPSDFLSQIKNQLEPTELPKPDIVASPKLPTNFHPFTDMDRWIAQPYITYLLDRGFTRLDIERMTEEYGMYFASAGPFDHRIIFSLFYKRKLITWTGRTIYASSNILRYMTLTTEPGRAAAQGVEPAAGQLPDYLLWYDRLKNSKARTIYVVEGPFDALRINLLGKRHGICATCLFTSSYTKSQLSLLHDLLPRFEKRFLLLDREQRMLPIAMRMESDLSSLGITNTMLPEQVSDPAELNEGLLLGMNS
jgi:hypothetical protein